MKKLAIRTLFLLLAVSLGGVTLADQGETLTGQFIWTQDDGKTTGDLKAIFTETGEDAYDVTFHFDWEGEPHTWKGTAKGSLEKGKLEGEVTTDGEQKATWTFTGEFEKGGFQGTHAQVTKDGELRKTGTLTLQRS